MSKLYASQVWTLDLPRHIALVLLAMAQAADDQGDAWISVGHLAWQTGYSKRHARRIIKELRHRDLVHSDGNHHRLLLDRGPFKPPFEKQSRSRKVRIPVPLRWAVWERDNFTCRQCGLRRELQVDHVVPVSKGGGTELSNLQTLCGTCNARKGAKMMPFQRLMSGATRQ